MDDNEYLAIELSFWDDTVGAFDPLKVVRQLRKAFPEAELDVTDYQQVRLLRELEGWAKAEMAEETRSTLVQQSWDLYQRCGPTYRFVVPFPTGQRVRGTARRRSVCFFVPKDSPAEDRDLLIGFLRSLRMGEPKYLDRDNDPPEDDD